MGNGHNNDDDDRKDLTRIEDLSEFLHQEDPDLESKFGDFDKSYHKADGTSTAVTGVNEALNLTDLTELDEQDEALPSLPETEAETEAEPETEMDMGMAMDSDLPDLPASEDFAFESTAFDEPLAEDTPLEEMSFEETPSEEPLFDESPFESSLLEETQGEELSYAEEEAAVEITPPERFEEVKSFAQNFSYGQIQGGGNPPFSLVIRNLKYEDDKESILSVLSEFGLVTEQNHDETVRALDLGSLLVPQISEFSAIVLAHKLRRFDCDLEVGLSDEVHPSKSGEHNPKGLVKKDSLRQNISESYKKSEKQPEARDIIISTTAQLEGYVVKKYIGIQTSFAIVDEEELDRLKFVQQQARAKSELHDYHPEESDDPSHSTERAFLDYKSSFDYLFVSLAEELKSKAQKEKANALLGLSYQLQSLPFEKTPSGKNCYQLTASATMALVSPE